MTREEAINIMKVIVHMLEEKYDTDRVEDAVDMAIEALSAEPCEDCISREAVLDAINKYIEKSQSRGTIDDFISFEELVVKDLPSVQPIRPKGEWIEKTVRGSMSLVCSECGADLGSICETDFCPTCGADMRCNI